MNYKARIKIVDAGTSGSIAKAYYYDSRIDHNRSSLLIEGDVINIVSVERENNSSQESTLINEIAKHNVVFFEAGIQFEERENPEEQNIVTDTGMADNVDEIRENGSNESLDTEDTSADNVDETNENGSMVATSTDSSVEVTKKQGVEMLRVNIINFLDLATTQDDFIQIIFKHFDFKEKYFEPFKCLFEYVLTTSEKNVKWENIEALNDSKIIFSRYDRNVTANAIRKLYDVSVKFSVLSVIKLMVECLKEVNPVWNTNSSNELDDKMTTQNYFPSVNVDIPKFNVQMSNLHLYITPELKANYVLDCMGIGIVEDSDKLAILEMVKVAINQEKVFSILEILEKTSIMPNERIMKQAALADFVNNFFESRGATEKIQCVTFLNELRDLVQKK